MPIRVLLADDHAKIRESLRTLLAGTPGIEVIGEAEDGRKAVQLAHQLLPDVVVMDVDMPVLDGVEATRWIIRNTRVIAFTGPVEEDTRERLLEAGVSAFLPKGSGAEEIVSALKAVAETRIQ